MGTPKATWVTVRWQARCAGAVPLDEDALAAIVAWVTIRAPAASAHLLLSVSAPASRRER